MSVIYIIAMDVTLPYLATGFKVAKFERARQTCKRLFLKYLPSYPLAFGLSQNYEIFFNSKGYAFEKSIVIYYCCPLKPDTTINLRCTIPFYQHEVHTASRRRWLAVVLFPAI